MLLSRSRFGVVWIGEHILDLTELNVDWPPERNGGAKVAYSSRAAELFDRAAGIAKRDGATRTGVVHLLAAFSTETEGLMGEIKRRYGLSDAVWRAELARSPRESEPVAEAHRLGVMTEKEFFTPDEAAAFLGLHIQTVRGYVRSGKLPAMRVAGERAIRISKQDLLGLLEPVEPTTSEDSQV